MVAVIKSFRPKSRFFNTKKSILGEPAPKNKTAHIECLNNKSFR